MVVTVNHCHTNGVVSHHINGGELSGIWSLLPVKRRLSVRKRQPALLTPRINTRRLAIDTVNGIRDIDTSTLVEWSYAALYGRH